MKMKMKTKTRKKVLAIIILLVATLPYEEGSELRMVVTVKSKDNLKNTQLLKPFMWMCWSITQISRNIHYFFLSGELIYFFSVT